MDRSAKKIPIEKLMREKLICIICREKNWGAVYKQLNCGHAFHRKCMLQWVNSGANIRCPICRSRIFSVSKKTARSALPADASENAGESSADAIPRMAPPFNPPLEFSNGTPPTSHREETEAPPISAFAAASSTQQSSSSSGSLPADTGAASKTALPMEAGIAPNAANTTDTRGATISHSTPLPIPLQSGVRTERRSLSLMIRLGNAISDLQFSSADRVTSLSFHFLSNDSTYDSTSVALVSELPRDTAPLQTTTQEPTLLPSNHNGPDATIQQEQSLAANNAAEATETTPRRQSQNGVVRGIRMNLGENEAHYASMRIRVPSGVISLACKFLIFIRSLLEPDIPFQVYRTPTPLNITVRSTGRIIQRR